MKRRGSTKGRAGVIATPQSSDDYPANEAVTNINIESHDPNETYYLLVQLLKTPVRVC